MTTNWLDCVRQIDNLWRKLLDCRPNVLKANNTKIEWHNSTCYKEWFVSHISLSEQSKQNYFSSHEKWPARKCKTLKLQRISSKCMLNKGHFLPWWLIRLKILQLLRCKCFRCIWKNNQFFLKIRTIKEQKNPY